MKYQKSFLTLITLLASFQICFGQEKLQAEQIDKFGNIACDDFLARLDIFFNSLGNDQHSTNYAIIYSDKNKSQARYEAWINGEIYQAKFDDSRFITKRAEKKASVDVVEVEFWKVPVGVDLPDFVEQKKSFVLPLATKAFKLSMSSYDICPTLSPKVFADYLQANPNLRGHIVIFNESIQKAKKEGENWLNLLNKEYDISRNQLKFFYRKSQPNFDVVTEFWLVPRKKK
ncbi:MAG: hypothetical protein ABI686_10510 [Acidobacteriota bacterium]